MSDQLGNGNNDTNGKQRFVWSKKATIISAVVAAAALVTAGAVVTVDQVTRATVPEMSGKTYAQAKSATSAAGLHLTVDEDASDVFCVGDDVRDDLCGITSQTPESGKRVHTDEPVNIVLAPVETTVPHVTGKTFQDARTELNDAGFDAVPLDQTDSGIDGVLGWKVASQDHDSAQATAGSVIHLGLERPLLKGPEVVGMTAAKASAALSDAGFSPVIEGSMPQLDADSDVSQKAFDAAWVVTGTTPAIKDGKYPAGNVGISWELRVPKLVGMEGEDAEALLEALGLEEGSDSTYTERIVASQKPAAGKKIAPGDSVDIFGQPPSIVYEVVGNGSRAAVTWIPPDSYNIAQDTNASLPWRKKFETDGDYNNFNAQALNGNRITCNVYIDGQKVSTNTSTGQYAVVSCG